MLTNEDGFERECDVTIAQARRLARQFVGLPPALRTGRLPMSRVNAPAVLSPVQAVPRGRLTPQRKRALMALQGVLCAREGCSECWVEIDHVAPLALGGRDEDGNCEGLCRACHLIKTRADVKAIAKANRIIARRNGTRRPRKPIPARADGGWPKGKRKMQSRGFAK